MLKLPLHPLRSLLCGGLLLVAGAAHAIEPFVITDFRINGLQKLDEGTLFSYLPLSIGDQVDDEEAQLSIKALFATGFFKDVSLRRDGSILVVDVEERPSISEVTISGNEAIETAALNSGLEQAGLVAGRIFNDLQLKRVEKEIKSAYLDQGRYSTVVNAAVVEQERNRVAINIDIREGRVATIQKINIIGAKAYKEDDLLDDMQLKVGKGLNPFSSRNQYSKVKLRADIENLQSFYQDRGYFDFKVIDNSVQLSPNKQGVFIGITIEEGELYEFGDIVFNGESPRDPAALPGVKQIKKGKPFSRKAVSLARSEVRDMFSDEGFAFAEVTPEYLVDTENNEIEVVFNLDPNNRVYVRRIDIRGNTFTRDEVIRRELRQFEGGWFSSEQVNLSRLRLQRLGYFSSVEVTTPAVPGSDDQVDMVVTVAERSTGSINISGGFSDADGVLIGASYQQRNLFGTGKEINIDVNTSDVARTIAVEYVNPYYTEDGVSRGFSLSDRKVDASEASTAEYIVDTLAAAVNYQVPISETNSFNFGFAYQRLEFSTTNETPNEISTLIEQQPEADNFVANIGISKNATDDFFFPTSGGLGSIGLEVAVPGSDQEYYKANAQGAYYFPITRALTLKGGAGVAFGDSYGDSSEGSLPFNQNYFAGGSRSVRGYRSRSLGPRDSGPTPQTLGGDKRVLANVEVLFPPYGTNDVIDTRIGLFVDAGMVFGPDEDIDLDTVRYSAGLSYNWNSPLGPLSLSYGVPLNDETGDQTQEFQITFGTVFR